VVTSIRRSTRAEYTRESIAAAEFSSDQVAVRTERFAQRGDLNFEVLLRYDDPGPYSVQQVLFGDQQSIGFQQNQKEIESACAQLYWDILGEQLTLA
jgi:hypothetical protein